MDVRVRASFVCASTKDAAERLAARVKDFGLPVLIEAGYKGQLALVIDGKLIEPPLGPMGRNLPINEREAWLFNELERRHGLLFEEWKGLLFQELDTLTAI